MIQCFKRHTGCHGAITDNGDGLALRALYSSTDCHAECCADRCAGMSDTKGIVLALASCRKCSGATLLSYFGHFVPAAGQDFMRVSLMAHIPYDAVFGGIENIV